MKKISLILLTVVCLTSCSQESFLDRTVTSDLDENTVFKDSTYTVAFLSDIYTAVGFSSEPSRFNAVFVGTSGGLHTATDEAEPHLIANITTDVQFVTGTVNSVTVDRAAWTTGYSYIRKVNQFLKHLPETPLSDLKKKQYKGEALFLRAWYYANLLQHYGGVPIVGDTIYAAADKIPAVRNSYKETVDYIVSQCDLAAQNLTVRPVGRNYGRAGAGACLALKARVLLYAASPLFNGSSYSAPYNELLGYPTADADRWRIAMEAAKDVMNLGVYYLYVDNVKEPGYGYYAIFNATDSGGDAVAIRSESIFEKQAQNNGAFERLFNPPSREGSGSGGYPYQDLVDEFEMSNGKSIDATNSGYNLQNPYVNRDPRFYNTIIYDQAQLPIGKNTGSFGPVNIYLGNKDGKPADQDAVHTGTKTGYYINKFRNRSITGTDGAGSSQERPLIRYAEVLLNYAEARNEFQGPDAEVYKAVEAIRERAGLVPYKLTGGLDQNQMRDVIRHERRIELSFEGHRFWDVRRWKIADQTESKTMHGLEITRDGSNATFRVFDVRKHVFREAQYFWPFPYDEVAKSPNLKQNPGY